MDSQIQRSGLWLPRVGGRERDVCTGSLGWVDATITFKMDKQQSSTVQHRKLDPISWETTKWKRI